MRNAGYKHWRRNAKKKKKKHEKERRDFTRTLSVMARQVGNDGDINKLNEMTHYTRAADFELLGARPPVAAQQEAQRKESFTLKLVWLQDRVRQMPQTDDPETLRQYARCYIMLLIRGYLMTDKSNNLVHLRWLPLLRDFTECRVFSWSSAVLAWTYQSLSLVAQQGITDIADYTPLLMSWIYQRFSQWCPPDRGVYQYPLTARLVGFPQQIRDQHEARVLRWRVSLDRLRFDEVSSYYAYLNTTGRGEDVWWPLKLKEWHLSGKEVLEDPRPAKLPPNVQPTASQPRDDLALPRGVPD
ncbi:hypothetical protein Ahy_B06g084669 [Arachis hypogaea]|uniref:Aminotransferase-like plant mobile domain-containing protein n=1 Tax=Arachis hypogaea TaxID=3818 RepID=A0A444YSI6_ARAHY|nr:hypothetical protein Ahy_B06g084669 [Arachis hypogaea]